MRCRLHILFSKDTRPDGQTVFPLSPCDRSDQVLQLVSALMMMLDAECKSLRKSPDDILIAESPPSLESRIPSQYCARRPPDIVSRYHELTIN